MKKEVKVSFYLNRNENKKDGRCAVIARLTVGSTDQARFSTKITLPAELWGSGRAAGKSHEATGINNKLDEIRASAMARYCELSAIRENVTAEDVKCLVLGVAFGQQTLLPYFRAHNENFDLRVGVNRAKGSAKGYWHAFNHLENFLKEKYNLSDIPFSALDRSFIDKFDLYLKIECGLAPGTIVLITTRLNTIIRCAVADGLITRFPFAGYVAERPERQQKYLTREQLNRLMITPITDSKLLVVRDLFLFSCFTGIPYSDMSTLSGEDMSVADDGTVWIRKRRTKTGNGYEVPLLDTPLLLLDRYRDKAPGGLLLPMYSISHINRQLKNIAALCGIDRRLTYHVARHTYATEITLSQGVPIETVSRMLGHSRISTTQIYARITDDKIDEDMKAPERACADIPQTTLRY